METAFWASILFVLYVYAGYPLLLAVWAAVASRPVSRQRSSAERPTVSIVIAAHNEADRLPGRIRKLLAQDYPRPLEIIVVSDGSTDGTAAAVAPFSDRIRLIELPRGGKPRALNAGSRPHTATLLSSPTRDSASHRMPSPRSLPISKIRSSAA
jgi:cellulose synthase/poly-beta-1,6-N-acetylglucosamine synthase-like glycosyltransferase